MEEMTIIGVILFVGSLAIKELFAWFKQRNLQNSDERLKAVEKAVKEATEKLANINKKVDELHEWHDRRDGDGVPVWYVRKSLEQIVQQNADAVIALTQQSSIQTQVLTQISEGQKDMLIEIRRLHVVPSQSVA